MNETIDRGPGESATGISGIVIAQEEEKNIERCVSSLAFCMEVVVVDGGSRDKTADLARALGARVIVHDFDGMNAQKDRARKAARYPWVLNLDADEEIPQELAAEIVKAVETARDDVAGFKIPRKSYMGDQWLRWGGYYPDYQLRLVRRERARWDSAYNPHDKVVVDGKVLKLSAPMIHRAAPDLDFMRVRAERYAGAAAKAMYERGEKAGPAMPWVHAAARFIKSYFLKGGILMGRVGLTLAAYQAYEVLEKYKGLARLCRGG